MKRCRTAIACCVLLLCCGTSFAHNIWVTPEGDDSVRLYFELTPKPVDGAHVGRVIEQGKTWTRTIGERAPDDATVTEAEKDGCKWGEIATKAEAPRAVTLVCTVGVVRERMHYFHGKYLDVQTAKELVALASEELLPLDIVPKMVDGRIQLTILFEKKPAVGRTVFCWTPDGESTKARTDREGVVTFDVDQKGVHHFSIAYVIEDESGEYDGKEYGAMMYGTTLTMRLPLE